MIISVSNEGELWETKIGKMEVLDAEIYRWRSGKVFIRYLLKDLIGELAKDMKKNVAANYDNLVVITGCEGSGKSNMAYALAAEYSRQCGQEFDISSQYVYSTEDFRDKLRSGDDFRGIFWMDEGSNMANNRDWNTTDNKSLIQLLEMCRSRGWTLILCIPSVDRLDLYIREYRLRYLIECKPMKFEKYGPRERGYFELKKKASYGKMEVVGYGMFSPMPAEQKEIYEALKLDSQNKKIKEVVDPERPGAKYKAKYEESCKRMDSVMCSLYESGHDKDSLMQLFGIESEKTFHNRISKARKDREEL